MRDKTDTELARKLTTKLEAWRPTWKWKIVNESPDIWIIYRPEDGRARWHRTTDYVVELALDDDLIMDAFIRQEIEGAVS